MTDAERDALLTALGEAVLFLLAHTEDGATADQFDNLHAAVLAARKSATP